MTMIDAPAVHVVLEGDGALCADESHRAVDNVCVSCATLHLPSMAVKAYCQCSSPDLFYRGSGAVGGRGIPTWTCQTCELPNLEAIRRPLV